MKYLLIFLIFSVKAFSQTKDSSNTEFSEVFKSYSNKYQNLIVLYPASDSWKWTHYRIIYKTKKKWYLIDRFSSLAFKDSVIARKCSNCEWVYQQLLENEHLLKSESEITAPCREIDLMNYHGDTVTKVLQDLSWNIDIGSQVLEYNINQKTKKIYQTWPELAMKICPESIERNAFLDLVNKIKNIQ